MYTTTEASREIKIEPSTFRQRANTIGLIPIKKKGIFIWNEKQIDAVNSYKKIKRTNNFNYSKKKINIVDFYLTHRNNTQIEIADSMGISVSTVNRVLNEYLNTGHVIVASCINVNNFHKQ